jgi:DNA invertase Pin-like site-specific DNA recombinase
MNGSPPPDPEAAVHADHSPKIAYSYLRFSTAGQEGGDSLRRQTEAATRWCAANNALLDESTTYRDLGKSAFLGDHKKNPDRHALAAFLKLTEAGRIPRDGYLLVEALDRLTREHLRAAVTLFLSILEQGVNIVTTGNGRVFRHDSDDMTDVIIAVVELARGHGESKRKSEMCGAAWGVKKDAARSDAKTPPTRMCPAWLEVVGVKKVKNGTSWRLDFTEAKYRVKEDAARTVRTMFEWCAAGMGTFGILQRLIREKVPPIGRTGKWERSYIRKTLTNPAAMGTYQPQSGSRKRARDGEPVEGFYPVVVSAALFDAAQRATRGRDGKSGRPPKAGTFNPFAGLLTDAVTGSKLHVCGSRPHSKRLVSAEAVQKRAERRTFPVVALVDGLLSLLRELEASELFSDPGASEVAGLEEKLAAAESRLAVATVKWENDPESQHWQGQVDKWDREKRAVVKDLAEARSRAACPASAAWAEAVAVMAQADPGRLRQALLATVEGVPCLFVRRGLDDLAAVQVWFKGGKYRDFLIFNRQARGGAAGDYRAKSLSEVIQPGDLDLRQADDAARLAQLLGDIDLAGLWEALAPEA